MEELVLSKLSEIADSLRRIADVLESQTNQTKTDVERSIALAPGTITRVEIQPVEKSALSAEADSPESEGNRSSTSADRRNIIREFLTSRNIKIKTEPAQDSADETLNKLAVYMGSKYGDIAMFYKKIKSAMNQGTPINLNLKDMPQSTISSTCQLAYMLHEIAFLEEYKYKNAPYFQLFARPSRFPKALSFFSGGWLERYGVSESYEAARSVNPSIECSHLSNIQIVLPNGDDFELDLLFEARGSIHWVELKTGSHHEYIAKYSKMSKILKLDVAHSYMVLTDVSPETAKTLSALFKMTVTRAESFEDAIRSTIIHDLAIEEKC
ncbi:MAG: hypothetical protein IT350_08525 [Deltaproteobacteria bacterium]|nr:hypothetical protein [Deltaproteobacteria bacterium]